MNNLIFKTTNGDVVDLNERDMHRIHQHYIEQSTADYLRDNYEDWTEKKIQEIAVETRRQMYKYDFSEEEAIKAALKLYDENKKEKFYSEEMVTGITAPKRSKKR